jgi:pimeloyl-ACP methyl ester carboxylesterase
MPTVDIDGIAPHYESSGSRPPILMMAPGSFDSAIEKWSTTWPWQHFLPLQTFARDYTCIAYDRREAGKSGGRVEQLTWGAYADQAKGLSGQPVVVLRIRISREGTAWNLDCKANMRS